MKEGAQVCAVCGWPLNHQTLDGGTPDEVSAWIHVRSSLDDHAPVPVPNTEIPFHIRCDFCDAMPVTEVLICRDFEMPTPRAAQLAGAQMGKRLVESSLGPWAACEVCGQYARKGRWSYIVSHVRRTGGEFARATPRSHLTELYERVGRNLIEIITADEWRERTQLQGT